MTTTIAIPQPIAERLRSGALLDIESAWLGTAGEWSRGVDTSIAVSTMEPVADSSYIERERQRLVLGSIGWVPALRRAAHAKRAVVYAHSHPGGSAAFSSADRQVEADMRATLDSMQGGADVTLVCVVVAGSGRIAARLWPPGSDAPARVQRVRIAGRRLELHLDGMTAASSSFDRQVRALGMAGQQVLSQLRIGLVGAGGTGSAVYELLVRLGVGNLTVIDPDDLSATSVSRGFGSRLDQVGLAKVVVANDHAAQIGLGTVVTAIAGTVCEESNAELLAHCDVVFACTDDHAGRMVLNRLAYSCAVPVVDLGVLVSSISGALQSVDARVTWVAPGTACLLCRGRVDAAIAAAERLDPAVRAARAEEGYAPELGEPDPSVIAYTAGIAALSVTEMLHRLIGVSDDQASELLWSAVDQRLSTNDRRGRAECFCQKEQPPIDQSFLGLTWAA